MVVDFKLRLLDTASWKGRTISGRRVKSLLRALAEAGPRGLSTQGLIETIWSYEAPAHPAKALQILVSRARSQTSAETIGRTERGYRLELATNELDVWARDARVSNGETALNSGNFFEAANLANAALTLADDSRARRVLALALSKQRHYGKALPILEDLCEEKPFDEPLAAHYVRALAEIEGTAAALEKYAAIQHNLQTTLGATPGPELAKVHRHLLALDQPVRSGLRFSSTSLLGREDDISKLNQLLASQRLISIVGPGGLGKTRLAQEVARSIAHAHVHVIELAAIRSPSEVIVTVAEALQTHDPVTGMGHNAQRRDLWSRLTTHLNSGPHFLIFDNCEHVIEGVTGLVNDLLANVIDLQILTTSRKPLRLTSEYAYVLDQLATKDAQELFIERALSARDNIALQDGEVETLVNHLDGLPLAIELAAARARTHTVQGMIDKLTHRFDLLQGNDQTAPHRHQTLMAVIDWSWQLLGQNSQQALMHMSLLPDSFTMQCAEGLLGADAMRVIENLVDQSLVSVFEYGGHVRFRMLETIREYGMLKAQESEMQQKAQDLIEGWAIRTCEAEAPKILGTDQLSSVSTIRADELNLTHILRKFLERRDDRAVVVLSTLLPYWMVTGAHLNIVLHFDPIEKFFASWQHVAEHQEAARQSLAVVATTWGMLPQWKNLPQSLSLLVKLGTDSSDGIVQGLSRIGITIIQQANEQQSSENTSQVESLVSSDDRYTYLLSIPFLAGIRENSGDLNGAISLLEQVVGTLDDDVPPWLTARYRELLSQLHLQIGNSAKAKYHGELALPMLAGLGKTLQCQAVLACALLNIGHLDEAEERLHEVLDTEHENGASDSYYMLTIGLAEIALAKGKTEYGLLLLDETLRDNYHRTPIPGMPASDGLDPWSLMKYGIVTAAYAQHTPAGHEELLTTLLDRAVSATDRQREYFDLPVLGTVAFALATWGSYRGGIDTTHITMLASLALRLRYNRVFPALHWEALETVVSKHQSTQISSQTDFLETLQQAEVIEQYHKCVSTIASAGKI